MELIYPKTSFDKKLKNINTAEIWQLSRTCASAPDSCRNNRIVHPISANSYSRLTRYHRDKGKKK